MPPQGEMEPQADGVASPANSNLSNNNRENQDIQPSIDGISMSEAERLDALHTAHLMLLNPTHDHVITAHLAHIHATGNRSQVLDVGTGTGTWALSLARRHPYADVIGVDINWSNFKPSPLPHGNADFYTVDVTEPLPWPPNTFDLIHVESMLMDIPKYPRLIHRLAEVLRPGGLMILVESELFYHRIQGPPSQELTEFVAGLKSALAARDTDPDLPSRLDSTIASTGLFSPHFYFQEIGCPVGTYVEGSSETLHHAGRIQSAVVNASLDRLTCHRIGPGPERAYLQSLVEGCSYALHSPNSRYLQRLFAVYAYKKPPRQRRAYHSV